MDKALEINTSENLIMIGKIVNTSGVKGQVKAIFYADDYTVFKKAGVVIIESEEYEVLSHRAVKGSVVLTLSGVDTVEKAQILKNKNVYVDCERLPKPPPGRYYIKDILGLDVRLPNGDVLGRITDVLKPGPTDVYEVKNTCGKEFLIPVIPEVVKEYNLEDRYISIVPLAGLLE